MRAMDNELGQEPESLGFLPERLEGLERPFMKFARTSLRCLEPDESGIGGLVLRRI